MTAGQELSGGARGKFLLTLAPQVRFAVHREFEAVNTPVLRELILEALQERGWTAERIQQEYVKYAARCVRTGEKNLFPGGRV